MPTTPPIKVPLLGVDQYSKEFKKMLKSARAIGRSVEKVGRSMSRYITAPLVAGGVAGSKFSIDLNKAMANVGTLIPGRRAELVALKGEVQDLSIAVGGVDTAIAEGLYETISAFPDEADPMKKLAISARMALAGSAETTEAIGLLSLATEKYGDTSDVATQQVSDMAFTTVRLGQTTFPELATSMGDFITVAASMKVPIEEVFGVMTSLTTGPGSASRVATQGAALLTAFIKPTEAMVALAKKRKFTSAAVMVSELGLAGAVKVLGEETQGSTDALGKLISRKEGMVAAMELMGAKSKTFASNIKAMGTSAGATDAALKEQTEGINKAGFRLNQAVASAKKLGVQIGDKLIPIVVRFAEKVMPLAEEISKLSDEQLIWRMKLAATVAALGPLLVGIGKLIAVFPYLKSAFVASTALAGRMTTQMAAASTQTVALGVAEDGLSTKVAFTNRKLTAAIAQMGLLKTATLAVGAAVAGWAIGTVIYDQWIKPLMDAIRLTEKARGIVEEVRAPGGTDIYTTGALKQKAQALRAEIARDEAGLLQLQESSLARTGMQIMPQVSPELKKMKAALADIESRISEKTATERAGDAGYVDIETGQSVAPGQGRQFEFDQGLLQAMRSESKIEISFKGLPEGVSTKVDGGRSAPGVKVQPRGPIMGGAY